MQGLSKVIGVNDRTLQILQHGLENTVSMHQETSSATDRHGFDEAESPMEQEAHSVTSSDQGRNSTDFMYDVDNSLRHIGSRPRLTNVVRSYGNSKANDTAEPSHRTS